MDPSTNTQYGSSDDITPSTESPTIIITIPPYIPNSYFENKIKSMFDRYDQIYESMSARSYQRSEKNTNNSSN